MIHDVIHLKDVFPFLGDEDRDPTLFVYVPDNSPEFCRTDVRRPAVLICPGGGYAMTSDREAEPIALNLLPWGYNVFILRYSVAPNRFPTQLREVAAAMELIAANEEQWLTDSKHIAIMGFSAGGHLACHYSNCYDIPEVRGQFPESKPVKASILCYPVISAKPGVGHLGSIQNLSGHEELTDEDIRKFSLEDLVTEKTPPAFLWHTAEDDVVPLANSLLYAQALKDHGVSCALQVYPAGWHGLATVDDLTNGSLPEQVKICHGWLDSLRTWLQFHL